MTTKKIFSELISPAITFFALMLSFGIFIVEMLTYPNAIQAKTRVPAIFILYAASIIFFVFDAKTGNKNLLRRVTQIFQKILIAFLPITIFCYLLLSFWDRNNHPNFVLSTFHIHLSGFEHILLVQGFFGLLLFFRMPIPSKKIPQTRLILTFGFIGFLAITHLIWQNFKLLTQMAIDSYAFMIKYPFATYDEKLSKVVPIYPFYKFVVEHTPENAVIALPPFREPWTYTSNAGFTRYFLYPRKVQNASSTADLLSDRFTHALIAYDTPNEPYEEYRWPQSEVMGKSIMYYDFSSDTSSKSAANIYKVHPSSGSEIWGLIEL